MPGANKSVKRKLVAIVAADVAGYSRLMDHDEDRTLQMLSERREIIDGLITTHSGRIFNTAGDSVAAEFPSAVEAVRCSIRIQDKIKKLNDKERRPPNERMEFRIGVHLGDAMVMGTDLYGAAVNIAARLESLAEPGAIWVSSAVRDEIWNKISSTFVDMGKHKLKNIRNPIQAYRFVGDLRAIDPYLQVNIDSNNKTNFPIVLVRYSLEEMQAGSTLRTKINVVFKNNGLKTAVLNKILINKTASVAAIDCPKRGFNLFLPEWDYHADVESDREIVGQHYLTPNEVETFDVVFGRARGGPHFTIYKVDLSFYFDELEQPITINDLLIKISGPAVVLGYHTVGISKEEWCKCMAKNVLDFDANWIRL